MRRYVPVLLMILLPAGALRAQTAPTSAPVASAATAPKAVALPATLEPFESADIYAKDAGYLTEVRADIGDHVKQGQQLATIDDPELQSQLVVAQAALAVRQEMVKAADAALEQSRKNREVVRSQLAGYEAELTLAQATLQRQEELFAAKAITDQQRDETHARVQVTGAQAEVARAKVGASDADVAAADAGRAVAQAQVTAAEAEVARLRTLQQYLRIAAPFDGVITRRMVSRGDLVQSGAGNRATPLFTCQRIDIIRVFCDVPESSVAAVAPGTPASVKIFGLDNWVVTGTVTRIAHSLNVATRTMRAEIDLPNPDEKLRAGMYAQVTLTLSNP